MPAWGNFPANGHHQGKSRYSHAVARRTGSPEAYVRRAFELRVSSKPCPSTNSSCQADGLRYHPSIWKCRQIPVELMGRKVDRSSRHLDFGRRTMLNRTNGKTAINT